MAITFYKKTALTGGGTSALDGIVGTGLLDGDVAFIFVSNVKYTYQLDDDSGATDDGINIIAPDTNPGTKRWILQTGVPAVALGALSTKNPPIDADKVVYRNSAASDSLVTSTWTQIKAFLGLAITAGKTITVTQNTSLDEAVAMSSKLTMALGAANLKAFMNAAGTAPEWAKGIKVGTFTRDTAANNGDVTYTAVGFKPTAIIFIQALGTAPARWSVGMGTDAVNYCIFFGGTTLGTGPYVIRGGDLSSVDGTAVIKTMDTDGFTLTYANKTGSSTGTANVYYMAFR